MTTPMDLKTSLADVRRAYRLIYAYQRRVFDLIGAAAEPLESAGFEFDGWSPALFSLPGKSFHKPDKWAWDFLPSYALVANWNHAAQGNTRRVSIALWSDTGFERKRGEPDPADFLPAEKSQSELRLGFWRSGGTPNWSHAGQALAALGELKDGDYDVPIDGVLCHYRKLRLDLSELVDEAAVDRKLLIPLRQWMTGA